MTKELNKDRKTVPELLECVVQKCMDCMGYDRLSASARADIDDCCVEDCALFDCRKIAIYQRLNGDK